MGAERRRGGGETDLEGGLELRMGDVRLVEAQPARPDEALVLGRLAREPLPDERRLGDHSLPALLHALARLHDAEHLVLRDGADFGQGHLPLAGLLLALLLNGVGEDLGAGGLRRRGVGGRGKIMVTRVSH